MPPATCQIWAAGAARILQRAFRWQYKTPVLTWPHSLALLAVLQQASPWRVHAAGSQCQQGPKLICVPRGPVGGGIPSQVSPARADSKVGDTLNRVACQSLLACQLSGTSRRLAVDSMQCVHIPAHHCSTLAWPLQCPRLPSATWLLVRLSSGDLHSTQVKCNGRCMPQMLS